MTNKEAVEIMNIEKQCCLRNIEREAGIKDCNCDRECNKCDLLRTDAEIIEAYNVAIKALEQEPCEDAISRQAVLDINEIARKMYEKEPMFYDK